MVKKSAKKTVKKTAKKTKSNVKDQAKSTPFKSKLGHDPLAWITGEDATELGISYDSIKSDDESKVVDEVSVQQSTINQLDKILPTEDTSDKDESYLAETIKDGFNVEISLNDKQEPEPNQVSTLADDGSWGLFDDEPVAVVPAIQKEEAVSDDGSWGLFGIEDENSDLPIGEGVAWGLFSEDQESDASVENDAVVIHLPVSFVVNDINKVFHEFEDVVHKHKDVIVDASQVESIDAAGLQLLYAGRKELLKRDCKMVIKDASQRIQLLSKSTFIYEMIGIAV